MHSVTNLGQIKTAPSSGRFDRGEVSLSASVTIVIGDTTNYFPLESANLQIAHNSNYSLLSNRLTYVGTDLRLCFFIACFSITCASSNQDLFAQFQVNGSALDQTRIKRKVGTGSDTGAVALVGMHEMSNGDYITLAFRNSTTAANITIPFMNMSIFGFGP